MSEYFSEYRPRFECTALTDASAYNVSSVGKCHVLTVTSGDSIAVMRFIKFLIPVSLSQRTWYLSVSKREVLLTHH